MSGNVVRWSTHFDIRILVPMSCSKLRNYIYIYIYIYIVRPSCRVRPVVAVVVVVLCPCCVVLWFEPCTIDENVGLTCLPRFPAAHRKCRTLAISRLQRHMPMANQVLTGRGKHLEIRTGEARCALRSWVRTKLLFCEWPATTYEWTICICICIVIYSSSDN